MPSQDDVCSGGIVAGKASFDAASCLGHVAKQFGRAEFLSGVSLLGKVCSEQELRLRVRPLSPREDVDDDVRGFVGRHQKERPPQGRHIVSSEVSVRVIRGYAAGRWARDRRPPCVFSELGQVDVGRLAELRKVRLRNINRRTEATRRTSSSAFGGSVTSDNSPSRRARALDRSTGPAQQGPPRHPPPAR